MKDTVYCPYQSDVKARCIGCPDAKQCEHRDSIIKKIISNSKNRYIMKQKIKDLKRGDFFKLADTVTAPVWVRDDYNRSTKKYWCYKFDDTSHCREFKGDKEVITDFEF